MNVNGIPAVGAAVGQAANANEPMTLPEVVVVFRKWLYLPDPGALYVVLAAWLPTGCLATPSVAGAAFGSTMDGAAAQYLVGPGVGP